MSTCGDCGCAEGEFHSPGCDMERCPFCGGQLISCDCHLKHFGYEPDWTKPNCNLPEDIYNNGLPEEQAEEWDKKLKEKGLVPFIRYPLVCARCGELWPKMFHVDDEEWKYYIEIGERRKLLCRSCFDDIKRIIDAGPKGPFKRDRVVHG